MAALIRGCLHVNIETLQGTEEEKEEEFCKLWGQTAYYLKEVNQVNWK